MNPNSFFPNAVATVIGLPERFDLIAALKNAELIRLATAFAHMSGWRRIAEGITGTKGKAQLLTGLYFCQTEPRLLRKWRLLAKKNPRIEPKLFGGKQMFHPKVLIVTSAPPLSSFALVGSGNLSKGGLITNVECWLFTAAKENVAALSLWFDDHFKQSRDLTLQAIQDYEPRHKKAQKASRAVEREQREIEEKLFQIDEATIAKRAKAIKEAKKYFQSKAFLNSWPKRRRAVDRLRASLNYPDFNLTKKRWTEFYENPILGHLIPICARA